MKFKEKLINFKDDVLLNEEQAEIRRFGLTVVALFVIVGLVFVFTKYVINDGDINIVVFDSVEGQVNYNVVSVGTMLGKADEEYYVYAYSSEDVKVVSYQIVASLYTSQTDVDVLPVYYLDIDNIFNESYLETDENPENVDAANIDELALGDLTLIRVKNGKIVEYITDFEDIEEELAVTE